MSYSKFADLLYRRALHSAPISSLYDEMSLDNAPRRRWTYRSKGSGIATWAATPGMKRWLRRPSRKCSAPPAAGPTGPARWRSRRCLLLLREGGSINLTTPEYTRSPTLGCGIFLEFSLAPQLPVNPDTIVSHRHSPFPRLTGLYFRASLPDRC